MHLVLRNCWNPSISPINFLFTENVHSCLKAAMSGHSGDPQVHPLAQSRVKENKLLRIVSSVNILKNWEICNIAGPPIPLLVQAHSGILFPYVKQSLLNFSSCPLLLNLTSGTTEMSLAHFSRILKQHWPHDPLPMTVITPLSTQYWFCSSQTVRSGRDVSSNVQASISLLTCEYNWLYLPLSFSLFVLLSNGFNSFWFCFWTLAFSLSFL